MDSLRDERKLTAGTTSRHRRSHHSQIVEYVPENSVPVEIIHRGLVCFDRRDPAGVAKVLGINFRPRTIAAE
jgi:hypothetical protein